jgi:hypothetical protein
VIADSSLNFGNSQAFCPDAIEDSRELTIRILFSLSEKISMFFLIELGYVSSSLELKKILI